MSSENIIFFMQFIAFIFVFFLIYYAWRLWREIKNTEPYKDEDNASNVFSTQRLNPSYFGTKNLENMPKMHLPIAVMAKGNAEFTYSEILEVAKIYNLKNFGNHFELLDRDGISPLISWKAINSKKSFANQASVNGILLILDLPTQEAANESVETLLGLAHQLSNILDGRVCSPQSHQILNEDDLGNYRRAAKDFNQKYRQWQNER